jgi:cytochrome c2
MWVSSRSAWCSDCHSLTGAPGAGPHWQGLAGSTVALSDGSSVSPDNAYLAKAITNPGAEIVNGYQQGIMSAAVSSFGLAGKPDDVAALVAFVKTQR